MNGDTLTFMYKSLCGYDVLFFFCKYLGVELLSYMLSVYLTL